jgi:hypothetical protein
MNFASGPKTKLLFTHGSSIFFLTTDTAGFGGVDEGTAGLRLANGEEGHAGLS